MKDTKDCHPSILEIVEHLLLTDYAKCLDEIRFNERSSVKYKKALIESRYIENLMNFIKDLRVEYSKDIKEK